MAKTNKKTTLNLFLLKTIYIISFLDRNRGRTRVFAILTILTISTILYRRLYYMFFFFIYFFACRNNKGRGRPCAVRSYRRRFVGERRVDVVPSPQGAQERGPGRVGHQAGRVGEVRRHTGVPRLRQAGELISNF